MKNPCLDYIEHIVLAPPGATFEVAGKSYSEYVIGAEGREQRIESKNREREWRVRMESENRENDPVEIEGREREYILEYQYIERSRL